MTDGMSRKYFLVILTLNMCIIPSCTLYLYRVPTHLKIDGVLDVIMLLYR